jgi:serine/threonine protein kinase
MRYANGGSLDVLLHQQSLKRFSEYTAREYFKNILTAVEYMHQHNIVHRDINVQNVVLTADETCMLIDPAQSLKLRIQSETGLHYLLPHMGLSGKEHFFRNIHSSALL